ncbi:MAG: lycopene cyclase domain-containing protein [Prolixibacteraceae bacterium]|nr:lycopene cyclase domain-containing protein [Prolixibacteraceae bacterium]
MEFKNFTYLLIIIGSLSVPLLYSFEKQVQYYKKMKYLLPAILFTGTIFIIWDLRFESLGIWSFNPDYVTGIYILNLPVEEWLFFLVIPYCFVFIYEIIKIKLPDSGKADLYVIISLIFLAFFALLTYIARAKLYTFFTFFLLTIYFGYTIFRNRFKQNLMKFYLAYIISLLPFMIVNGILTALPVVTYNNMHNLGIRLFTIPVEDFAYLFLIMLMNITIYEYLKSNFRLN